MSGQAERSSAGVGDRDAQISALADVVEALTRKLRRVEARVNELVTKPRQDSSADEEVAAEPAPWVWSSPPAVAGSDPAGDGDPRTTVENFVAWYNITFVGVDGSRARPIPPCWSQHPGLAMEVAALAYSWRAANVGANSAERDAQQWLHQWRPGFTERLVRDWVRPDCLDGEHREDEPARVDRFEIVEQFR